ncbi:MAG: hypothetical protein WDN01_12060 [Rhizomicrobium sp.]
MTNDVFHDVYSMLGVRPEVSCIPGSTSPAKLSLVFASPPDLERALAKPPSEAILEIHLTMESVVELSSQIQTFLKTMGK